MGGTRFCSVPITMAVFQHNMSHVSSYLRTRAGAARSSVSEVKAPSPSHIPQDPYANQGKQLFFLQDRDGMCLGPLGFGACDGRAAWIVADRKEVRPMPRLSGVKATLGRSWPRVVLLSSRGDAV
jgi:hypothetical protein